MAVYIQKYELMINYLTNILFLIIIAITYIKMKINKWVSLGFTLVIMEKVLRQVMTSTHMIIMVSVEFSYHCLLHIQDEKLLC